VEGWGVIEWGSVLLFDVGTKLTLIDRFEKRVHFVFFAGGLKFDATVGQVPDKSGEIESCGDSPDGITKADTLNVSFVENLNKCVHQPKIGVVRCRRQQQDAVTVLSEARLGEDQVQATAPGVEQGGGHWNQY
jgi:hypothetical protein